MEQMLFEAMAEAMEKRNELELEFMIAEQEYQALCRAYKAYKQQ